jgi:hypothetical protein
VQVLEHYGATIGANGPYLATVQENIIDTPMMFELTTDELKKRVLVASKLKKIAIAFMKRADRRCYGGLWSNFENNLPEAKTITSLASPVPIISFSITSHLQFLANTTCDEKDRRMKILDYLSSRTDRQFTIFLGNNCKPPFAIYLAYQPTVHFVPSTANYGQVNFCRCSCSGSG